MAKKFDFVIVEDWDWRLFNPACGCWDCAARLKSAGAWGLQLHTETVHECCQDHRLHHVKVCHAKDGDGPPGNASVELAQMIERQL